MLNRWCCLLQRISFPLSISTSTKAERSLNSEQLLLMNIKLVKSKVVGLFLQVAKALKEISCKKVSLGSHALLKQWLAPRRAQHLHRTGPGTLRDLGESFHQEVPKGLPSGSPGVDRLCWKACVTPGADR